jgi:phosphoenolpyruvate---glycerone phosphotransferase subunit DhaL
VTGAQSWDAARLRAGLLNVCTRVPADSAELTRLDGLAGDGDLGQTLAVGLAAVAARLAADQPASTADVLVLAGTTLSRAAPSSFGTLLGLGLRAAGKQAAGAAGLDATGFVAVLTALADSVAARGQAAAGQRTMLDAILPAREAAAQAAADPGASVGQVVRAAADGAAKGAAATAGMRPAAGRAGWIGDRVVGSPDAGATAVALILQALAGDAGAGDGLPATGLGRR